MNTENVKKDIQLKGIASNVNTFKVNERCYFEFNLTTEGGESHNVFVRYEDAEWDIDNGGHYYISGFEVSNGTILATTVERWGRVCDVCGQWHTEGYWVGEEDYACSEECAIKLYDDDEEAFKADLALLDDPETIDLACTYWTEWE
jgi:hypothetical protein